MTGPGHPAIDRFIYLPNDDLPLRLVDANEKRYTASVAHRMNRNSIRVFPNRNRKASKTVVNARLGSGFCLD
jgi:hypothetical protein